MRTDKKAALILKLKQNKLIRFCFYPYQNLKRFILKKTFKNSKHGKRLLLLKNKFEGRRCFIIGNGPSLTPEDLDKIKNEYSFAANKIFYIYDKTEWRPTFYSCGDPEVYITIKDYFLSCDIEYKFLSRLCGIPKKIDNSLYPFYPHDGRFCINKYNFSPPFISENVNEFISLGGTVTFTNIQLAIYMGFKEIYLLGVDHNYALTQDGSGKINKDDSIKVYFEGMPKSDLPAIHNINETTKAYQAAREYADNHGIKIYNATRGGKLEAFERIDFDTLFKEDIL